MLLRRNLVLGAVSFGWLATTAGASQASKTYFEGPSSQTLPLQRGGDGKLSLVVQVMGKDLVMAIDTGGATMLDMSVANHLNLTFSEPVDAGYALGGGAVQHKAANVDMMLGKLKINGLPILCMDLGQPKAVSQARGWPVYDGLIGPELLTALRATMDFTRPALTVRCPG